MAGTRHQVPRLIEWARTNRLAAFALVAALLTASCSYVAPSVTWIPWACVLGGSAVLITGRTTGEPVLARMVLTSYCIRMLLGVILYVISSQHLPIFPSFHRNYGSWEFGGDGAGYHDHALKVLDAWHTGIDLPSAFMDQGVLYDLSKGLSLPMAMVYAVLGTSPLHFILVNAWLGAMSGVLAYLLAARLGDRRSALVAGGLIAFWPSSVLWSTQLLKDPATLALVLAALLSIVALWQRYSSTDAAPPRMSADIARWGALAGAVFGLTYFRNYLGALLTMSVAPVMAAALGRALLRRRWREAIVAIGIALLVCTATVLSISTDLYILLSPRHPEVAHVRRGDNFRAAGEFQQAVWAYRRAIQLNPTYAPAFRALSIALTEQGEHTEAQDALDAYLALEPDLNEREATRRLIAAVAPAVAADHDSTSPALVATVPPPAWAHRFYGSFPAFLARWRGAAERPLSWFSARNLTALRRAQVATGGDSIIDRTLGFDGLWDVFAYVPRAFAIAYLAPFPSQWAFTGGASGIMRPISAFEVVLIALLMPAMLAACWRCATRFRPEEWVLMAYIGIVAFGHGLMMPNGGTLFRLRLQYLFPTLTLASTALPGLVYRFFGTVSPLSDATRRTRRVYDFTWRHFGEREVQETWEKDSYEYVRLIPAGLLGGPGKRGLEIGCGGGADLLRLAANGAQLVGFDLSAGVESARQLTRHLPNVDIVQGDVHALPFGSERFDFIYSFGVLHHLPDPQVAFADLSKLLKPGAPLITYLYEDLGDRSLAERFLLAAVRQVRRVTSRLPPVLLYSLCWGTVPAAWLFCSLPAHALRPIAPRLAKRFPFSHTLRWPVLAADLFDRFAPPVEWRFSDREVRQLYDRAGFERVETRPYRGWVSWGFKAPRRT
jgi:SAM-dependent methyltransferase/tetratricopeptide (TPR) repeat protein